jgi:hypothetical protein
MKKLLYLTWSVVLLLSLAGFSYAGEWCGCSRITGAVNYSAPSSITTYAVPAPSNVTYIYTPWFVPAPTVYIHYPVPAVQTVWVPTIQYVATPQVTYQKYHIFKY